MKKTFSVILFFIFIFSLLSLIGCDKQQGNVDQHKHNYIDQVVNSTCTAQGYTLHTCSCGNSYKDNYVSAKGHNYTSKITKEATVYETGLKTYTCQNCGDTFNETITKIKSDWQILELEDEFGYKTGEKSLVGIFDATYTNGSTVSSYSCKVALVIHGETIRVHVYIGNTELDIFNTEDTSLSVATKTATFTSTFTTNDESNNRTKYGLMWGCFLKPTSYVVNGIDGIPSVYEDVIGKFKTHSTLDVVMYLSKNKTQYKFTMNNARFSDFYSSLEASRSK